MPRSGLNNGNGGLLGWLVWWRKPTCDTTERDLEELAERYRQSSIYLRQQADHAITCFDRRRHPR